MAKSTWVLLLLLVATIAVMYPPQETSIAGQAAMYVVKTKKAMQPTPAVETGAMATGEVETGAVAPTESETGTVAADEIEKEEVIVNSNGYVAYDEKAVIAAIAADKNVVLFFHATRCPSCKAADTAFTAEQATIPADVVIFKVDYDTHTALKAKYGVATQHTFVALNKDMSAANKMSGAGSVEDILKLLGK